MLQWPWWFTISFTKKPGQISIFEMYYINLDDVKYHSWQIKNISKEKSIDDVSLVEQEIAREMQNNWVMKDVRNIIS